MNFNVIKFKVEYNEIFFHYFEFILNNLNNTSKMT
jgi:hypothetical protein